MRSTRLLAALSGLGLITTVLLCASPPAQAVVEACWADEPNDLDGGGPDVVVGLPAYDLPGIVDAGAIVVFSNVGVKGENEPRTPSDVRLITAPDVGLTAEPGARFGSAVGVWQDAADFEDADDCADLLVGAPGETVGGQAGAGRVHLLRGSEGGIDDVVRSFDESATGAGGPQEGAGFGTAVAADTWGAIVIGAPFRDVGSAVDAGRVLRYDWHDPQDLPDPTVISQDGAGDLAAESGDRFGEVLELTPTADGEALVVGIPHEDVGGEVDAGAVQLVPPNGDPTSLVTQDSPGAGGSAEAGDRYGSSVSLWWTYTTQILGRIAVGVPREDTSAGKDSGVVALARFFYDPSGDGFGRLTGDAGQVSQDSPGVPGAAETGDRYGAAVLVGEIGQASGRPNLVVSAPREDLGVDPDAGAVASTRFETDASPLTGLYPRTWTQDSPGVPGAVEPGDRFGGQLRAVLLTTIEDDEDDTWPVVLVTVPAEDIGGDPDVGAAYLGYPGAAGSIPLPLPVHQPGAGLGMVPMDSQAQP